MRKLAPSFCSKESGAALIEAAVGIALIAVVAVAATKHTGFKTGVLLCKADRKWASATGSSGAATETCEEYIIDAHGFPPGYG
jgi:Flp pilus assembly pilin Flp